MGNLANDNIFIESRSGKRIGPVKASVQGNRIYIFDPKLTIEEGGKIFRALPNGMSECHAILQVDYLKGGRLSHYEITTRKDSSLVATPKSTTININNSQGIQIGDGNVQNIVTAFEAFLKAVESSGCAEEEKTGVKQRLKDFLSHPLTISVLGAGAEKLLSML